MIIRLVPILALSALLLGGCNESATETSKDVSQAQEKTSEDVSTAVQDASTVGDKVEDKVSEVSSMAS